MSNSTIDNNHNLTWKSWAISALCLLLPIACAHSAPTAIPPETGDSTIKESKNLELFRVRSGVLSEFWGHDVYIEAIVVSPPRRETGERLPVAFYFHGFSNWPNESQRFGQRILEKLNAPDSDYPRMIYVFPRAYVNNINHEFADSVNNGPWGEAFTTEFVPAVETKYDARSTRESRFLSGHSSGGWGALWLQVTYPDIFGGAWSASPDSADFRDFTGVDIYTFKNAYENNDGNPIEFLRVKGMWKTTLKEFIAKDPFGKKQFDSFDAVFSPRGIRGKPKPLFNRKSGKIDHKVAEYWQRYDISLVLRENWVRLAPKLAGKMHIYCGLDDTYRLEGAAKLLQEELNALHSDAEVILIPGMDHNTLRPHPELWPNGLLERMHREMMQSLIEKKSARVENLSPDVALMEPRAA
jgi:enterochelin esterase-like enzyme